MDILPMMLGVSLFLGALGLAGFLWGWRQGLFDDPERVRYKILLDDEEEARYQQMLKDQKP
ncbi:MAG: cbb3-type cytochrome oxidase assembly protein CcoS [bacterium]|jgi:cbb3-type cytochrome oxidase maturation protein